MSQQMKPETIERMRESMDFADTWAENHVDFMMALMNIVDKRVPQRVVLRGLFSGACNIGWISAVIWMLEGRMPSDDDIKTAQDILKAWKLRKETEEGGFHEHD